MACIKKEGKNRNAAAAPSMEATDALLFATMCIIGLPVEVHAKDGSVYSGIFHTASVENDYGIVLKKARMIKKGNQRTNLEKSLIETLIISAEDLVQVVAKEVPPPANGVTGWGDGKVKVSRTKESKRNRKHKSHARFSAQKENGFPHSSTAKTENVLASLSDEHNNRLDKTETVKRDEANNVLQTQEIRGSNLSVANCDNQSAAAVNTLEQTNIREIPKGIDSDETALTVSSPSHVSVSSAPILKVNSTSRLSASSTSFQPPVPTKSSSVKQMVKESTLNPRAQTFSPAILHHRTVPSPAVPNRTNVSYKPDTYTVGPTATAQQQVDVNSFAHSSIPVKFVPHNTTIGNGGNTVSYTQPIMGQTMSRTQTVSYGGQYHNLQMSPSYAHSNSQNVMLGRVGPYVCMHPISNEVVPTVPGFPQANARSLVTPHQVHLPKYQGIVPNQALQLCITPPIISSVAQPFVMPSSIPISQPLFPVLQPVMVPRSNGFFPSKFA